MDNLFRGIGVSFRDCKRLTIPMGYALRRSRLLVWSGQLCRGMSGNFAWNRRQLCGGISGSFYAESVATFGWNRWQLSRGIRKPRTGERIRAKQGAKRAARASFQGQRRPAVWAIRARVEKGVDLLLEEVPLQGAEEVFGLRQGQPKMLDALMVLVEGNDIGDGLFITLIVTHDELQFDTHTGASPGSSDR